MAANVGKLLGPLKSQGLPGLCEDMASSPFVHMTMYLTWDYLKHQPAWDWLEHRHQGVPRICVLLTWPAASSALLVAWASCSAAFLSATSSACCPCAAAFKPAAAAVAAAGGSG